MTIAANYAEFAAREARGVSPAYERLSLAVSRDDEVLALLGTLPPAKRQPNLLFGVVRFLGGPVEAPGAVAGLGPPTGPGPTPRRARRRAAAAIAAAEPPLLVRGDLVDDLPALAAQAPGGATLVVFHTSVMYHVPALRREAFAGVVRALPGHWIANEASDVLPYDGLPKPPGEALHNVLALDGRPLAWSRSHGQAITWFA